MSDRRSLVDGIKATPPPVDPARERDFVHQGKPQPTPQTPVIDRVPLNWTQVLLTWLKMAIILVLVILLVAGIIWYQNRGKI